MTTKTAAILAAALLVAGCDTGAVPQGTDGAMEMDSSVLLPDGGLDAGNDAGQTPTDAGHDAGGNDAGHDTGIIPPDSGLDAGGDSGQTPMDSGTGVDAGQDAGVQDSGTGVVDAGMDSGTGPDAGTDSGTGVDAGTLVWILEVWGYHVPDTRWTPGYASSSPWDPGMAYPATNPDVVVVGQLPDPLTDNDADTLDRAATAPRWSWPAAAVGTLAVVDAAPGPTDTVGRCAVTPALKAAAQADGQLRTQTCVSDWLLTTAVTPDDVTVTWRIVATYQ